MSRNFLVVLETTLALSQQLKDLLSLDPSQQQQQGQPQETLTDALPLLSASASTLKAQITKLSLLAINAPFTPSAVCSILTTLNESVLPSLAAASVLVTPAAYTKAFHAEIQSSCRNVIAEVELLALAIKRIAQRRDGAAAADKDAVTARTARIWDLCDLLVDVAGKGVAGFVVRRAQQWRDLVRDAIEELDQWDPNDDDANEVWDEISGVDGENGNDDDDDDAGNDGHAQSEDDATALLAGKKATVRFLKPLAQMYSAMITYRLQGAPATTSVGAADYISRLEAVMRDLQQIPEFVDEAAGALYEGDAQSSAQHLTRAMECARQAVGTVALPWAGDDGGSRSAVEDDRFALWSRTWLNVMQEVGEALYSSAA